MDGMRKCLAEDFSRIYVFNLRGNQRTSGELSRREGGKIFGSGSRTPVAVTVLVKNPGHAGPAEIYYSDIGDYLSRRQKLDILTERRDIYGEGMGWRRIAPDANGDWISQRDSRFGGFVPIGDKDAGGNGRTVFCQRYSHGLKTQRDAWCYNSSKGALLSNVKATIGFFNGQQESFSRAAGKSRGLSPQDFICYDPRNISWTSSLISRVASREPLRFSRGNAVVSLYRPFFKQNLYLDRALNERVSQIPRLFPTPGHRNKVICVSGVGVTKEFSAIITDIIPDLEVIGKSQCFPRYYFEEADCGVAKPIRDGADIDGYVRHDGVTGYILEECRSRYGPEVTRNQIFRYVYGILHSDDYRKRFSVDLKKSLPRIPLVGSPDEFSAFAEAGKALERIHLNYEKATPYAGVKVTGADSGKFQVAKMRFVKKGDVSKGESSVIQYNPHVRIEGIPAEAFRYVLNGQSAIEWVMERYQETVHKDSGIRNDPNDWAREHGDPRYVLDLLLRVITVSLETMRIVKGLPRLEF
jgi:predicted helicase